MEEAGWNALIPLLARVTLVRIESAGTDVYSPGETHDFEAPPDVLSVGQTRAQDALMTKAKGTGVEVAFLARLMTVEVSEILSEQVVRRVGGHGRQNSSSGLHYSRQGRGESGDLRLNRNFYRTTCRRPGVQGTGSSSVAGTLARVADGGVGSEE